MQYLEDIVELVDDLPTEMEKRFRRIQELDKEVEELHGQCLELSNKLYNTTAPDEKRQIVDQIGESYRTMRAYTQEKLDISERSERLMAAIMDKVNESAYHCKIELEVDNPGCTEAIERNFCNSFGLYAAQPCSSNGIMRFEPILQPDFRRNEAMPSTSTASHGPRPVGRPRNVLKERTNKYKDKSGTGSARPSPSPSPVPHQLNLHSGVADKKNKKRLVGKSGTMSAYMRKKQEKEREKAKLLEIHAARQREDKRKNLPEQSLDMVSFCAQACGSGASSDTLREQSGTPSLNDAADDVSWSGGAMDPHDTDDDFDANDVLDLFPSMLPSPPREILESLKEDSMFNLEDDMSLGFHDSGTSNHSSFPVMTHSPSPAPSISRASSHYKEPLTPGSLISMSDGSVHEKKRKNITFGSESDTSLHGRPRKLTDRAVELLQMAREKFKKKEEEVNDGDEKWCYCREGSSGKMICCDNNNCAVQWFHFECIGIYDSPSGAWYCPDCSSQMVSS